MKTAAIYARVSSDKQREENTIASQTAALVAFARAQQFEVPKEWVFEDDGYSGANLIRPGLERVRDLAAEGLIQAVLIYAPDRLSRRYAHQILLIEEFARAGVETLFVRTPRGSTPEDELLVQFQGMIAEYERAQILERSRRGKRHRARQGEVSVLSGAPFGYRFIRKTDHSAAYYQINEEQARVVRWMFELYSVQGLSIGAIARLLNEQAIPTCKRRGRWERSTVWGMLRNPAYKGQACFGKTTIAPRQRITRPIRMRGGIATRNSASHERPRGDWITIAVPPIVSEEIFALAQERLETNKTHAPRRTVTPSVVQGLVSCSKCGYALYRTSTRSSARKIHYYRCLGSDAYRHLGKFICDNRPVRQDLLDEVVWTEIVRLLEDPQLLQCEIDRRLAAARKADPTKRREEAHGRVGETAWSVRPQAASGQDALHRLPPAASWRDAARLQGTIVRLPRLHPLVGKVAERQERGAANDGQVPFCPLAGRDQGLVPDQPASARTRTARLVVCGTHRSLCLLRHHG